MQLADALISAMAAANGLDIFTGNVTYHQVLKDLLQDCSTEV